MKCWRLGLACKTSDSTWPTVSAHERVRIIDTIIIDAISVVIVINAIFFLIIEKTKAQRRAVTCSRSPRMLLARWA